MRYFGMMGLAAGVLLAGCALGPKPPQAVAAEHAPVKPDAVRVYIAQCRPAQYETVARLDASKLGLFSSYQFNLHWIGLLRKQAAGLGANGVLLTKLAGTYPAPGPAFNALAIWEQPTGVRVASTSPSATCLQAAKLLRYKLGGQNHGGGRGLRMIPAGNPGGHG